MPINPNLTPEAESQSFECVRNRPKWPLCVITYWYADARLVGLLTADYEK